MDRDEARRIGSQKTVQFVCIGLFIAYLISVLIFGSYEKGLFNKLYWFHDFDYFPNILVGALGTIIFGYLLGGTLGKLILIKGWNSTLLGIFFSLLILSIGVFIGSLIGFISEGLYDSFYQSWFERVPAAAYDYLVKPIYWVLLFGLVPSLILGCLLGAFIKKTRKK